MRLVYFITCVFLAMRRCWLSFYFLCASLLAYSMRFLGYAYFCGIVLHASFWLRVFCHASFDKPGRLQNKSKNQDKTVAEQIVHIAYELYSLIGGGGLT